MKHIFVAIVTALGLNACSVYRDCSSGTFSIEEISLGMNREFIVEKYGEPFSFSICTKGKDTVAVLSYKTPKVVANRGFIITTRLQFVNNELRKISQEDFFEADKVIVLDSTSVPSQEK